MGAVVAVALAAAFVAWVLVDRRASRSATPAITVTVPAGTAAAAPTPAPAVIQPRIVSFGQLASVAAASPAPLYWAGPRADTRYELTRTGSGTIYLRYLPLGRAAGDRKPALTIVSYPIADGYGAVRAAARARGAEKLELPGGGVAVLERSRPTNVHLAYPGQKAQIEVYAPQPGAARRLVLSGAVRPLS